MPNLIDKPHLEGRLERRFTARNELGGGVRVEPRAPDGELFLGHVGDRGFLRYDEAAGIQLLFQKLAQALKKLLRLESCIGTPQANRSGAKQRVRQSLGGDLQIWVTPAKTEPQLLRQSQPVFPLGIGNRSRAKTVDTNQKGSKRRLYQDFVVAQHSPCGASYSEFIWMTSTR
ncbi:MAG: hypothetical protein ABJB12_02360 [Pseudomonadota bacterium]